MTNAIPDSDGIKIVSDADANARFDVFLAQQFPDISRSHLVRCIDAGLALINGSPAKKNVRLKAGDQVGVRAADMHRSFAPPLIAQDIKLDILFEDEHLIAVNKPAGLVVHPGSGNRDGTLVNALLFHAEALSEGSEENRPGIVHRLDKDTSGIVLTAKTNQAHERLAAMFAERTVEKHYLGFCVGTRPQEHASIDAPIGRGRGDPTMQQVVRTGKFAVTEYRLLAHRGKVSAVHFMPHTGRTHQIRVHASYGGFPIVADETYGGGVENVKKLPAMERPFAHQVLKCFERHALHAFRIRFAHPITGAPMDLLAPFPADFEAAISLFDGLDLRLRGEMPAPGTSQPKQPHPPKERTPRRAASRVRGRISL